MGVSIFRHFTLSQLQSMLATAAASGGNVTVRYRIKSGDGEREVEKAFPMRFEDFMEQLNIALEAADPDTYTPKITRTTARFS